MGKRELFLILGFAVTGILVFQLTAPAGREGEGFSLSRIWNRARAEIGSNAASAETRTRTTVAVPADVTELQLTDMPSGLEVQGEDRADVDCELTVSSTGPDPDTAMASAKRVVVRSDRLGSLLTLSMYYPPEARQTARATLRVPSRLAVRLQNGRRVRVSHVAAVRLDPAIGETHLTDVRGAITGTHRAGPITITTADTVKLDLLNSTATIAKVGRGVSLTIRGGGRTQTAETRGSMEIDTNNSDVTLSGHDGSLRVSGAGGRVHVDSPNGDTRLEMRSTELEITLRSAVTVTAQTSDEILRVFLVGAPPLAIDALTHGGTIQAAELGLQPAVLEGRQELQTPAAPGSATMALRNRRSDIVIRKAK